MFTVSVQTCFWASHRLTLADGSKERVHRHNWTVTAEVSRGELDDMGLVMDFRRLKTMVDSIVADFDNSQIEKLDYFEKNNSSAETMAKYIYDKLEPKLPGDVSLNRVIVAEQPGCAAEFSK